MDYDLVFCTGPAGTANVSGRGDGVAALKQERIRRSCWFGGGRGGREPGFLPGDLQAKINPYLRPLLDALREMMDFEQVKRYTDKM